jgi:hypothetical protein
MDCLRLHTGERHTSALVKVGHKNFHAVVVDEIGVRVLVEPKEMLRHTSPLLLRGKPYPIERMVRHLKRIGRERGMTAAAKIIIDEAMEENV